MNKKRLTEEARVFCAKLLQERRQAYRERDPAKYAEECKPLAALPAVDWEEALAEAEVSKSATNGGEPDA